MMMMMMKMKMMMMMMMMVRFTPRLWARWGRFVERLGFFAHKRCAQNTTQNRRRLKR